jgi:hypothetical protein
LRPCWRGAIVGFDRYSKKGSGRTDKRGREIGGYFFVVERRTRGQAAREIWKLIR